MKRATIILVACGSALALSACVGDSDEATNIRATEARLNAHGRTNDGPARWWWEYSTSQTAVKNGQGTRTPPRGPASSARDVKLSEVVTGLKASTTYWFRACGQDTNKMTPACGRVLSFTTTKGNSVAFTENRGGESLDPLVFTAAPATQQGLTLTTTPAGGSVRYRLEDTVSGQAGSSVVPFGGNCQSFAARRYDDAVQCSPSDPEVDLNLGDGNDLARIQGPGRNHFLYVDCGPGTDTLTLDGSLGFDNYGWANCETVQGP